MRSPQAEGRREELTQQIKAMGDKLRLLRTNLNEVATGVDLKVFTGKPEDIPFDWQKELLNLLRPMLNELTRLTARPRELERLRTEMARYQEQQRLAEKALGNLATLLMLQPEPELLPHLLQLQQAWEAQRRDIRTQLRLC